MTSEIAKLRERLPLYVTGRLAEVEAAEIKAALEANPALAAELSEFQEIKMAYREMEAEAPPDALFDKIVENIRSKEKQNTISRQTNRIGRLLERVFGSPKIAWGLAAAQLIVIAFLLAGPGSERRYVTLTAPVEKHESGVLIRVAFVETATEGKIRDLLTNLDASIIDGPTLQGIYTVQLKADSNGRFEMEALDKSPLVRSVEKGFN